MPALRTLGLVVMAAFVISIGSFGYITFQAILRDQSAQDALLKAGNACQDAITIGGNQVAEVVVPGGYTMRFVDNRIEIDGRNYPQDGFVLAFAENAPELESGTNRISVTISENMLVVTRIS